MTEKNEYSCTIPGTFVLDCSIQCSDCSVHHLEWVVFIWLFLRLDRLFRSHQGLTLNDSLKLYSLEYVLSLLPLTFCFYDKLTNTF